MDYKFSFLDSSDDAADAFDMLDAPTKTQEEKAGDKAIPEAWKVTEILLYDIAVQPNLHNDIGVMGAVPCADTERWLLVRAAGGDFAAAERLQATFSKKIEDTHNCLKISLSENEILSTMMSTNDDATGVYLDLPLALLETCIANGTSLQATGCHAWFQVGATDKYEQPVLAKAWKATGSMYYTARQITFYSQAHKFNENNELVGVYHQSSIKDTSHQYEHFARIHSGKVYCHTDFTQTASKERDYLSFAPGFLFVNQRLDSLYEASAWLHPQDVTRFVNSKDMTFPVIVNDFKEAEKLLNEIEDQMSKTHGKAFALCGELLEYQWRKPQYISVLRCGKDLPCSSTCDKLLFYNKETKAYECSGTYSLNHGSNPPKLVSSAGVDLYVRDVKGNITSFYKPHGFGEHTGVHKKNYKSINRLYTDFISSGETFESAKQTAVSRKVTKSMASKYSVIFFMMKKKPNTNKTQISIFWTAPLRNVKSSDAGVEVLKEHFPWRMYLIPTAYSYSTFFTEHELSMAKLKRKFVAAQEEEEKSAQQKLRAPKKRKTSRN